MCFAYGKYWKDRNALFKELDVKNQQAKQEIRFRQLKRCHKIIERQERGELISDDERVLVDSFTREHGKQAD